MLRNFKNSFTVTPSSRSLDLHEVWRALYSSHQLVAYRFRTTRYTPWLNAFIVSSLQGWVDFSLQLYDTVQIFQRICQRNIWKSVENWQSYRSSLVYYFLGRSVELSNRLTMTYYQARILSTDRISWIEKNTFLNSTECRTRLYVVVYVVQGSCY